MRLCALLTFALMAFSGVPCWGTIISFAGLHEESQKLTDLGMQVDLTGPQNLPPMSPDFGIYSGAYSCFHDANTSHYYSGDITLINPANRFMIEVARANNNGYDNPFTLTGYYKGKEVASHTVSLDPLGDITQVRIKASAMDQIIWKGAGWIFHPYQVRDFQITLAPILPPIVQATPPPGGAGTPITIGSPVPEPEMAGLFGIAATTMILRRFRKA